MTIDILSFTGNSQRRAISAGLRGEERDYFVGIVKRINATVATMPKTYEQDGKGDGAHRIAAAEQRQELDDIDPDIDIVWKHYHFKTEARAMKFAQKTVDSLRTAFGTVTVQRQVVASPFMSVKPSEHAQ